MSVQPKWITPPGTLGTIPEGSYYSVQLEAYDSDPVHYEIISGSLPRGIALSTSGLLSGVPTKQLLTSPIKFAVRAFTTKVVGSTTVVDRLADRTFTLTVNGDIPPEFITPAGLIEDIFTGEYIYTSVPGSTERTYGYQINYTQFDYCTISLVQGSLPPGVTITDKGLISGFVLTLDDLIWYNTFTFTLQVTNGSFSSLRTYEFGVYNRVCLTADTTYITSDNTFVTSDSAPVIPPIITTFPGSIGITKVGDYFTFKFSAFDVQNEPYRYTVVYGDQIGYDQYPYTYDEDFTTFDQGLLNLPFSLTLDPNSGWLYGRVDPIATSSHTYEFGIAAYWIINPNVIGQVSFFSLTVVDELLSAVTWLYPDFLGSIDNGSTSTFKVSAVASTGQELFYRLPIGYYTQLPQGLRLLSNGLISGRVSFQTFCLDGGTTTFDVTPVNGVSDPTTFDLDHSFAVEAYSLDGKISVIHTFTIKVNRVYDAPYENLFIQAMPPIDSRLVLDSLLKNTTVFPPSSIYRYNDPFFGVAKSVTYWHCYGLTSSTLNEYVTALKLNHYNKQLTLGSLKTARAVDSSGNVIYEVVYSEIVDDLVNNEGESINKVSRLAYPPLNGSIPSNSILVYPNSLDNMRTQVIDTLGQESNMLPTWMLSTQADGSVLGFTAGWVIAYTNPGESGKIVYDIQQYLTDNNVALNQVDFEADRYELDRTLNYYWDPRNNSWSPPPEITTFDAFVKPPDLVFKSLVERGSSLSYFDIQHQTISYINNLGGIDGPIDNTIHGKLIVFIKQQYYTDPPLTDNQAWTDNYAPGGPRIIPGQLEAEITPGVINERMGIYLVTLVGSMVTLTLVDNTTTYDYVTIQAGNSFNNASVYYPPAPGPNLTVVSWLAVPVIDPGETTFDQNSMQFIDPEIEWEGIVAGVNDAYILYPRPDVIPVV